jgi:hypothetical protein
LQPDFMRLNSKCRRYNCPFRGDSAVHRARQRSGCLWKGACENPARPGLLFPRPAAFQKGNEAIRIKPVFQRY